MSSQSIMTSLPNSVVQTSRRGSNLQIVGMQNDLGVITDDLSQATYLVIINPSRYGVLKGHRSDLGSLLEQGPQEGNDLQSLAQAHLICQHCPIPAHPQCMLIKTAHQICPSSTYTPNVCTIVNIVHNTHNCAYIMCSLIKPAHAFTDGLQAISQSCQLWSAPRHHCCAALTQWKGCMHSHKTICTGPLASALYSYADRKCHCQSKGLPVCFPQTHHTLIQKLHPLLLMRPQLAAYMGVHHHRGHPAAPFSLVPLCLV